MKKDLDIPAFLRRGPMTPAIQRHLDKLNVELHRPEIVLRPYDPSNATDDWYRPVGVSPEEWAARKAAANAKSLQRLKNCVPKSKRYGALPPDYNRQTHRWDPRRGQFVRDRSVQKLESGLIVAGAVTGRFTGSKHIEERPKAPAKTDPFGDVIARVRELPQSKFKEFALANGCWDARYSSLSSHGLQRMNVINRLRAKLRKGHTVKW